MQVQPMPRYCERYQKMNFKKDTADKHAVGLSVSPQRLCPQNCVLSSDSCQTAMCFFEHVGSPVKCSLEWDLTRRAVGSLCASSRPERNQLVRWRPNLVSESFIDSPQPPHLVGSRAAYIVMDRSQDKCGCRWELDAKEKETQCAWYDDQPTPR